MQLFAILGLVLLFMFGFWLPEATGEQHREAYFITPPFLWALKSFIKSLTKFLLFIAYCWCWLISSSALFVIKLLQCANVNTLNCPRWHPRCSQSVHDHIILRDISSVRVHLTYLWGREPENREMIFWGSDIPGPGSHSGGRGLTAGHPLNYANMSLWAA